MFYTGLDPETLKPVYVPKTAEEKYMQRTLLQYYKPENRRNVIEALIKAHREDLIGNGPECLVPADAQYMRRQRQAQQNQKERAAQNRGRGRTPRQSGPVGSRRAPASKRGKQGKGR